MKLLVITQTVDTIDTTLGFFTRWVDQLAQRFERVEVVCLQKGEYAAPSNVTVFSLGKENQNNLVRSRSKFVYTYNFYRYMWKERRNYDAVFVHMNQEYVLLGAIFWKFAGKKIFFWRNHRYGNVLTRIAVSLSDTVFCTSEDSYTARFAKTVIMPAGIDVEMFEKSSGGERDKNSLLMFGRIARVKNIEAGIDTMAILKSKRSPYMLTIVGDTQPGDQKYLGVLKERAERLGAADRVQFANGVEFARAPAVYQAHEIFLNFTPSGSFDKTVLEALASGSKVLTSNASMRDILPNGSYTDDKPIHIAESIEHIMTFDDAESRAYAEQAKVAVQSQSLDALMNKLFSYISHV